MPYEGGIITTKSKIRQTITRDNGYGVWSIGEVFQKKSQNNWILGFPYYSGNYTTTNGNSFTYPSGIESGDLLVLFSGGAGSNPANAFDNGFTEIINWSSSNPRFSVYYRVADGTETGSFNANGANEAGILTLFKKANDMIGTVQYDIAGSRSNGGSNGDVPLSMTTGEYGVAIACIAVDNNTFTLDSTDTLTLIGGISGGGVGVQMLYYETTASNTTYSFTPSFTNTNGTDGILFNIYTRNY